MVKKLHHFRYESIILFWYCCLAIFQCVVKCQHQLKPAKLSERDMLTYADFKKCRETLFIFGLDFIIPEHFTELLNIWKLCIEKTCN